MLLRLSESLREALGILFGLGSDDAQKGLILASVRGPLWTDRGPLQVAETSAFW